MDTCKACSASVSETMKFCPRCGSSLAQSISGEATKMPNQRIEEGVPPTAENTADEAKSRRRTAIFISVLTAVVITAMLSLSYVSNYTKQVEEESARQLQESVAQSCASKLSEIRPEIDSAVIVDTFGVRQVSIRPEDSTGTAIGDQASCTYEVDSAKNEFQVTSIKWGYRENGFEYSVDYDREANRFYTKEERIAPPKSESASTAKSCESAFRAAAAVPLSQDNNAEIRETTFACSDVDEWWSMLNRYPDVFGMTYYLDSEKGLYVGSACLVGSGSPVCNDAERKGLTF